MKEQGTKKKASGAKKTRTKHSTMQSMDNKLLVTTLKANKFTDLTAQDIEHSLYRRGVLVGALVCLFGILSSGIVLILMSLFDTSAWPNWAQLLYTLAKFVAGAVAAYLASAYWVRQGNKTMKAMDECHKVYQDDLDKQIKELEEKDNA